MYAGDPRIIPACVEPIVSVDESEPDEAGSCASPVNAFARPKSRIFTAFRRNSHVGWLQIAMYDSLLVCVLETLGDLGADFPGVLKRHRPLRRIALNELHNEASFFDAVDRSDVKIIERRQNLRLALEAGEPFGIFSERRRQHLDRDIALELGIAGAIYLTHAAAADQRQDPVLAQ
jgi:hypothetical protein